MKARAHEMHPLAELVLLVERDDRARAGGPGHDARPRSGGSRDPGNAGTNAEGDEDK